MSGFNEKELNLIREWFDTVQDIANIYLEKEDYVLASKIYESLGLRVPNSIKEKAEDSNSVNCE